MFLMATKVFGYDKQCAQRRVNAMELSIAVPQVLEKIESKELSLQTAADIQSFLNLERGKRRPYSSEQKAELVKICSGLSVRKVQIELSSRNPDLDFSESRRAVSKDRMRITYTTKNTTEEKLERIKQLRSHVNPYVTRDELIDYMAEVVLDKIDPIRKAGRAERRQSAKEENQSKAHDQHVDETQAEGQLNDRASYNQTLPHQLTILDEIVSETGEIQMAIDFDSLLNDAFATIKKAKDVNSFTNCDFTTISNHSDSNTPGFEDPLSAPRINEDQPSQSPSCLSGGADAMNHPTQNPMNNVIQTTPRKIRRSRYISAAADREVHRANASNGHPGGCCYVDPLSSLRCGSLHQLQRDHQTPYSYGGANTADNLQLMCAKHNRFRWENRYRWQRSGSSVRDPELAYA